MDSDQFWAQDPWVLVQSDAVFELVPTSSMPLAERYNALARLVIIITIAAALWLRKGWPLVIGGAALLLDWLLYRYQASTAEPLKPEPRPARLAEQRYAFEQRREMPSAQPAPVASAPAPPSAWEAFVRGPGENLVNGPSCAMDGTNPAMATELKRDHSPYDLSGLPSTSTPLPLSGAQHEATSMEFSSVPAGYESRRLPKADAGYMLDSGAPMNHAVAGPTARPQAQPMPRPQAQVLMFQGRQQTLQTADQPEQLPSQWPVQMPSTGMAPRAYQQQQQGYNAAQPQPMQQPATRREAAAAQPVCKPWHLMNEAEQINYLARQKRDAFVDRLFTDTSEGMNNYQFQITANFNEFEDRERYMDFMYGKDSMTSHFKDAFTATWERYEK